MPLLGPAAAMAPPSSSSDMESFRAFSWGTGLLLEGELLGAADRSACGRGVGGGILAAAEAATGTCAKSPKMHLSAIHIYPMYSVLLVKANEC